MHICTHNLNFQALFACRVRRHLIYTKHLCHLNGPIWWRLHVLTEVGSIIHRNPWGTLQNSHNPRQKICHERVADTVLWGAEQEEGASNWDHPKPHDVNNRRATFQIKGANNQDRSGGIRSNQQKAEKRKSQKSYLPDYIQAVFA